MYSNTKKGLNLTAPGPNAVHKPHVACVAAVAVALSAPKSLGTLYMNDSLLRILEIQNMTHINYCI